MSKSNLHRIFTVLLVILLSFSTLGILPVNSQVEDTWIELAPMQEKRRGLGVTEVDGKIYAICGDNQNPSVEEYNPQTNTWNYKTSAPEALVNFGMAVYNGKIYCFSSQTGKTFIYTPLYDSWEQKTPIPTISNNIVANTLGNEIFVLDGNTKTLHVYDPNNDSWSTKASSLYNLESRSSASTVLDGKIHVFGAVPLKYSHQIYNPISNSWSLGEPLVLSFLDPVVGATSGVNAPKRIYVFGREYFTGANFTAQSYDPNTNVWTLCASIPQGQSNGAGVFVDDKMYVVGGGIPFIGEYTTPSNLNSLYTPIGFGSPDPSYTPPPATPTPSPPQPEFPTMIVIVTAVILGMVAVGILAYYKKNRKES